MIEWLEKNKKVALLLTILITLEIFYFSSISVVVEIGAGGGNWIARVYHFVVFFLFSFFFFVTIKGNKKIKINHLLIVLIISLIHAVLDEVHQIFVPLRYPSISDVLTNSSGIFSSILIYLYIDKKIKQEG